MLDTYYRIQNCVPFRLRLFFIIFAFLPFFLCSAHSRLCAQKACRAMTRQRLPTVSGAQGMLGPALLVANWQPTVPLKVIFAPNCFEDSGAATYSERKVNKRCIFFKCFERSCLAGYASHLVAPIQETVILLYCYAAQLVALALMTSAAVWNENRIACASLY